MKGRTAYRAIKDAFLIAALRGIIELAGRAPGRLFDFAIIGASPVAFVRVRFAPHILLELGDIAREYREEIARLRAVARDSAVSIELWIRSRHGSWRFFRIVAAGIIEMDRDGKPIPGKQARAE